MNRSVHSGKKRAGTPRQIEALYGIPKGSLANLRYFKKGPRFFKLGRRVVYFLDDVEAWLRQDPRETIDSVPK